MDKRLLTYFLNDWHSGAVNQLIHTIGFTVLGYGLAMRSLLLVLLSGAVMEIGHLYELAKGKHKQYRLKIIPLQIISFAIYVAASILVLRFFKSQI